MDAESTERRVQLEVSGAGNELGPGKDFTSHLTSGGRSERRHQASL